MKKRKSIFIIFLLSMSLIVVSFFSTKSYTYSSGESGASGAPGETTCSRSGCHGAGQGGLPDNTGPGRIELTCSNMTNWEFVEGQTYHLTLNMHDSTAGIFGFSFSALDNTNNTSTGKFVFTDLVHTRLLTESVAGNVRYYVAHKSGPGSNRVSPGVFNFDWTAPNGVKEITFYFTGNGANNDGTNGPEDNIYSGQQIISLATSAGIEEELTVSSVISIFPNPSKYTININLNGMVKPETQYTVYSMNGMKMIDNMNYKPGAEVSLEGWKPGKYFVQMNLNGKALSKPFIVE
jgi:hypothetical protein